MSPKIRQALYALGCVATGTLTLLSLVRIVDPNTASTVSAQIAALLGIFGVGATGTAAVVVGKQRKDGTYEPQAPADQVINGIDAVIRAADHAQAEVDRVKDAITVAVRDVPVLGPLAQQAINKIS